MYVLKITDIICRTNVIGKGPPQDLFHSVYFEYEENCTHDRLLSLNYAFCHIKRLLKIRAVAGQRSSPDLCFATTSVKIYDP